MPFETECRKCAHARAATPTARSTPVEQAEPRPKEPVTLSEFIDPNNRLASLKSIIRRDTGFTAILVLLAIVFLMESTRFGYPRAVFAIWGVSVIRYQMMGLYAAILAGVLSLRYWGYVVALTFAGLALFLDIRRWLFLLSAGLHSPLSGISTLLHGWNSGLLLLVFYTGVDLFVAYGLVQRALYFNLPRVLHREHRTLQPVWIAGGMAALLICGWSLLSSYANKSYRRKLEAEIQCHEHVAQIARAMLMFAQDHHNTLPKADTWAADVMPYLDDAKMLQCPSDKSGTKTSYAINAAVSGQSLGSIKDPAMTVLLFESGQPGSVTCGGASDVATPPRHSGGNCYAFVDGHSTWGQETPDF